MRLIGWGDKEKAKNINEGLLGILRKAEMSKFIGWYFGAMKFGDRRKKTYRIVERSKGNKMLKLQVSFV